MQRNQKVCKLVEEFSLYILENHSYNLNIDIKEEEKKTIITFTTELLTDEIYEFLSEKLRPERLYEIEEYGWELMGEGASDDDLGIISALINEITYENKDDKTIIRMVRYE